MFEIIVIGHYGVNLLSNCGFYRYGATFWGYRVTFWGFFMVPKNVGLFEDIWNLFKKGLKKSFGSPEIVVKPSNSIFNTFCYRDGDSETSTRPSACRSKLVPMGATSENDFMTDSFF